MAQIFSMPRVAGNVFSIRTQTAAAPWRRQATGRQRPAPSARDDILHLALPAGEEEPHVLDDQWHDQFLILAGVAAEMRQDESVRQIPERTLGRQRLGLKHV